MAKDTPAAAQAETQGAPPLQLTVNDVVGAIQRLLWECNGYLQMTPVDQIDGRVIHLFMQRGAELGYSLPPPVGVADNNGQGRQAS